MFGIAKELLVLSVTSLKKYIYLKIYSLGATQIPIDHNMVDRNFRDSRKNLLIFFSMIGTVCKNYYLAKWPSLNHLIK